MNSFYIDAFTSLAITLVANVIIYFIIVSALKPSNAIREKLRNTMQISTVFMFGAIFIGFRYIF